VSVFRFARGNEERILGNAVPDAQAPCDEIPAPCCENATVPAGTRRSCLQRATGDASQDHRPPSPAAAMAQAERRA
jgi:hypothetical protein